MRNCCVGVSNISTCLLHLLNDSRFYVSYHSFPAPAQRLVECVPLNRRKSAHNHKEEQQARKLMIYTTSVPYYTSIFSYLAKSLKSTVGRISQIERGVRRYFPADWLSASVTAQIW